MQNLDFKQKQKNIIKKSIPFSKINLEVVKKDMLSKNNTSRHQKTKLDLSENDQKTHFKNIIDKYSNLNKNKTSFFEEKNKINNEVKICVPK